MTTTTRFIFRHLSWLLLVLVLSPPSSQAFSTLTRYRHSSIQHSTPCLLSQQQQRQELSKRKKNAFPNSQWVRARNDVRDFLLFSSSSSSFHTPTPVPTTWNEALRVFFGSRQYHGPRLIVLFLSILLYHRIELGFTMSTTTSVLQEIGVASAAIVFWWFQEHGMHQHLLHSPHFNWMGKDIHVHHHNQPYHHISIDSAPIMIGWLTVVHLVLRVALGAAWSMPLPYVDTATMAYGAAGLFYEWTHFIAHTKVRFSRDSFWTKVKNHHARHHLINHDYYFAFTITQIDDIFGTNPDISKVPRLKNRG